MSRRQMREHIFKILFRREFHQIDEMDGQIELYMESAAEEGLSGEDADEILSRIKAVLSYIDEIDEKIAAVTEGWTMQRIGKTELTILRLALYEMEYDESVPEKVAINEAVELAKKFGGDDTPVFVNGVLAKLV